MFFPILAKRTHCVCIIDGKSSLPDKRNKQRETLFMLGRCLHGDVISRAVCMVLSSKRAKPKNENQCSVDGGAERCKAPGSFTSFLCSYISLLLGCASPVAESILYLKRQSTCPSANAEHVNCSCAQLPALFRMGMLFRPHQSQAPMLNLESEASDVKKQRQHRIHGRRQELCPVSTGGSGSGFGCGSIWVQ